MIFSSNTGGLIAIYKLQCRPTLLQLNQLYQVYKPT